MTAAASDTDPMGTPTTSIDVLRQIHLQSGRLGRKTTALAQGIQATARGQVLDPAVDIR